MNIEIRRALPQEAETLTALAIAAKFSWGYPEDWLEIWRPELTFGADYIEKNEILTATVNDQPVGFYRLLEKDGNAWLEDLWIKPAYMGRGIGRLLFTHALKLSRQRGYKLLRWESDPNAVGFYIKMGAHQTGERHSEVEGQPRILPIMEIEL